MKAAISKSTAKRNKKTQIKAKLNKNLNTTVKTGKRLVPNLLKEDKIITRSMLQIIAFVTMFIDHIGKMFFPGVVAFEEVGRIAFPIFCFLLVEGFIHTHSRTKYYLRLVLFGIISEFPYNLYWNGTMFYEEKQNVIFELAFGFIALCIADLFERKFNKDKDKWVKNLLIWTFTAVIGVFAYAFKLDYGLYGILLIMMFWFFRNNKDEKDRFLNYLLMMVVLSLVFYFLGTQIFSIMALIPLYFYNSNPIRKVERNKKEYKYVNYLVYPAHLIVLRGTMMLLDKII